MGYDRASLDSPVINYGSEARTILRIRSLNLSVEKDRRFVGRCGETTLVPAISSTPEVWSYAHSAGASGNALRLLRGVTDLSLFECCDEDGVVLRSSEMGHNMAKGTSYM